MSFEKNVFINCPFDDKYFSLLRPLLFTIIYLKLNPRLTLENLDSGEARILKIIKLIEESKFSIHDLSRLKANKKGEFFRLNMPLELGIDIGCRYYKRLQWAEKKCLILETEKYRYQAAISDLSNSDIAAHYDEPEKIVKIVRVWLTNVAKLNKVDGSSRIWGAFNEFMAWNYDKLMDRGFSKEEIANLPINELIGEMTEWVQNNTQPKKK